MVSHARASAPQKQVQGTALLPDSETLWAGSYTGERYRIRNAKPQLHYKASSPIRSLLRIGNTLWIGLQDGLLRLVLTANGQPPSVQQEALPEHFIIWSQYHDTTGHWLETNQGLWLRLQHRWLHWDEVDGLPSRTIYGILPNATTLWLSTNQGLVRVFTDSLPKLRCIFVMMDKVSPQPLSHPEGYASCNNGLPNCKAISCAQPNCTRDLSATNTSTFHPKG